MKKDMLHMLRCPQCRNADLELSVSRQDDSGEIVEGTLVCKNDGREFQINNGIPRFVDSIGQLHDTKAKFEYQWKTWGGDEVIFGRTKEESKAYFLKYMGFNLNESYLANKVTLDAGCGHGRFVEIFSEMGASRSVGIDLGEGIYVAKKRNHARKNVDLAQGNLLELPFQDNTFDYIWCNGVAHHTPDAKRVVRNLSEALKPGGYVNIWLYPKGGFLWEASQSFLRAITTRLPPSVLYFLTYLAVPILYFVPTWSGTNPRKNTWKECAQVIYDWYSPKYQSHHTVQEVVEWFREFGFSEIDTPPFPVTVIARKPI